MSTHPIWMPSLRQLADQHYDVAVLDIIQTEALVQAMESRILFGLGITTADDHRQLRADAQSLLPSGFALQSLYFQRFANLSSRPIEELESACLTLSNCISALEGHASRQMTQDMTLPNWARVEQAIGERYATLMRGAKTLEDHGVMSPHHADRVSALTARPNGPLAAFYDKALVLAAGQNQAPRMKMAA